MKNELRTVTVLALIDHGLLKPGTKDFYPGESDHYVVQSLKKQARKVHVEMYGSLDQLLRLLDTHKPDVVFNLTQGVRGNRLQDSDICSVLELRRVPYTGATARGLMLGRDKAVSKMIAAAEGFRVPRFFVTDTAQPRVPEKPELPIIVKPRFGDASEGISGASVVRTKKALLERIEYLRKRRVADAICEEYVEGREFIVPVLCNRMIKPREFLIGKKEEPGSPLIASTSFKYDRKFRERWDIRCDFAQLTAEQVARLEEATLRTSAALAMRDYGRLDVRLTPEGEWVFLEANPNPGLAPYGTSFAGTWGGVKYDPMIREITLAALSRKPSVSGR